ncbi:hypothetical protein P4T48_26980 [Bacillus paramycoides]|uniref:hypothetical protein n=1 Tax=Bacillus paramycoides TaxID=2026194 RepID=UPI002E1FEAF9|nr:hypothetical protein [Bacillus paramycoides]
MSDKKTPLSQEDRDKLCKLLTKSFVIPEPYREAVKEAMMKYQNNLTEQHAEELVSQTFSPLDTLRSRQYNHKDNSYSQWRGFFTEWIIAIHYNTFVNKDNVVMTIVNPDPTSKCDLLHIVQNGAKYKCYPGPDIKTGSAAYLLNEFERICKLKREIALFDADGILSEENSVKLTKKQNERRRSLQAAYPKKKILQSQFSNADQMKITFDFLHYVSTQELPSSRTPKVPLNREEMHQLLNKAVEGKNIIKQKEVYPFSFSDLRLTIPEKTDQKIEVETKKDSISGEDKNSDVIKKADVFNILKQKKTVSKDLKPDFKLIREPVEDSSNVVKKLFSKGNDLLKNYEEPIKKYGLPILKVGAKLAINKIFKTRKGKKKSGITEVAEEIMDAGINFMNNHVSNLEETKAKGGWNVEGRTYDNEFWVDSYTRKDGTPVKGHWKGGKRDK